MTAEHLLLSWLSSKYKIINVRTFRNSCVDEISLTTCSMRSKPTQKFLFHKLIPKNATAKSILCLKFDLNNLKIFFCFLFYGIFVSEEAERNIFFFRLSEIIPLNAHKLVHFCCKDIAWLFNTPSSIQVGTDSV